MPRLIAFTQSGFDPASRFRLIQFIPHLQRAGWSVDHRSNRPDRQWRSNLSLRAARAIHYRCGRALMKLNRIRDLAASRRFDAAFINRDLAAEGKLFQTVFFPLLHRAVFDFDDAIFVGDRELIIRRMCKAAFWVTPGNKYLADYAAHFTDRITVIPTVIDTDRYVARNYQRDPAPSVLRVGWSGSDQSIGSTLVPHLPMLEALQRQTNFELVVITNTKPSISSKHLRWRFVPWRADQEEGLEGLFDIGIMPLIDDAFQKGKCGLKLLQYMASGLPAVASPVGVNTEILEHRSTGILASTDREWHEALRCLLSNPQLRQQMGEAARLRCENHYSVKRWLPVLLQLFEKVRSKQF